MMFDVAWIGTRIEEKCEVTANYFNGGVNRERCGEEAIFISNVLQ